MKTITIEARARESKGKGGARSTRREGRLPGVLYGQGQNITLSIDRRDFGKKVHDAHGENVIWDVVIDDAAPLKSLAREIQHDSISRRMIHVDFEHIDMTRRIHVAVAVHLNGEPDGVRNFGGVLEHVARELEVICLPSDIPASIDLDVTELGVGDSIHVSDLSPEGFEFLAEGSKVIAQVAAPTVEKVETEDEDEEAAEGAEETAEGADEEAKGDGDSDSK